MKFLFYVIFLFLGINVSGQKLYSNGKLISEGEYHVRTHNKDKYWKYYSHGKLESEGWYCDGKKSGEWKYYLSNGQLDYVIRYAEKYPDSKYTHGSWIRNSSNGGCYEGVTYPNLVVRGYMSDDELLGKVTFFHKNGETKEEGYYTNGLAVGEWKSFYNSGQLKEKGIYVKGMKFGKWEYYDKNGKIEKVGHFLKGLESGEWIYYFSNGNIKEQKILPEGDVNQYRTGIHKQFHDSGLFLEGAYSNGEKIGKWTVYVKNVAIRKTKEFIYDVPLENIWHDSKALNDNARKNYLEEHEYEYLSLGIKWIRRSIELDENYYNLETYALLLAKTGQYLKALKIVEKAIIIAKQNQIDYSAIKPVIVIASNLLLTKKSSRLDNYSLMKK